ncbi:MAG: C39 family peptidase [Anaerolineales bacterium]|nr:C39 family peptidase [Anaerolineales bacterium]
MLRPRRRWVALGCLVALALVGLLAAVYNLPFVQDRVGWRVSELRARIKYALFPPEQAVFTPDPTLQAMVQTTLAALTPTATLTPTAGPTLPPTVTPTPTIEPTPIPSSVQLSGVRHEYQKWNNCGPANLSMALSFWGWQGDQRGTAAYLKPNPRDKNVMPYEMAGFVQDETDLRIVVRVGGDLDMLKGFLAAGFPVIVEKGFEGEGFDGWMGHYEVITGYDDVRQRVTAQDSYIMPDLPVSYADLLTYWQAFNHTYLVIYPADREAEVMRLLGSQADEAANSQAAAEKASDEIFASTGRAQFFAWFNRGSSLVRLQDYAGAAQAFDEAYAIDAQLAVSDPEHRPWRMLWYQTGPYFAYFFTGRYGDVISLATQTLVNASEPTLEESWYWRARARAAIGDSAGAVDDLRTSLQYHEGFAPSLELLQALGAAP